MEAQTEDKKLDGAGLSVLWGLIKNIIPTVPTNVSSFTNDAAYVSLLDTHNQNLVLASPNGASGLPSFRALVAADIPDLSGTYLTSHQTIYGLTLQGDGTTVSTFTPNTAALTFNIKAGSNISLTRGTNEITIAGTANNYGVDVTGTADGNNYYIALSSAATGTNVSLKATDKITYYITSEYSGLILGKSGVTGELTFHDGWNGGNAFLRYSGSALGVSLDLPSTGGTLATQGWVSNSYLPLSGGKVTDYIDVSSKGFLSLGEVNTKAQTILGVYNNTSMNNGSLCAGSSITFNIGRTTTKSFGLKVTGESDWFSTFGFSFINNNLSGRELIRITYYGDVGLGIASPSYKLHVNGAVGATAFTNTSDIRSKDFISDTSMSIEQIANAPSFLFRWKTGDDRNVHAGSSAQYWQTVLPEIITTAKDEQHTLSMQYDVVALLSSITIAKEVVNDKERIRQLEQRVSQLEAQLAN